MRLIVLAAGGGTRMGHLTEVLPKLLVSLPDGTTILERNIRAMESVAPIEEMLLVSGHAAAVVDAAALRLRVRKPIRVQYNPFYRTSGPLVSVWLASAQMTDSDFLLCNGDTVYCPGALQYLANGDAGQIVLGVDRRTRRSDDDMKVRLDAKGNLERVGKDIPEGRAQGVSTGLLAVRGPDLRRTFIAGVCDMVRQEENLRPGVAWHSILNALIRSGVPISTTDLDGSDWYEVDTVEDLGGVPPSAVGTGLQSVRRACTNNGHERGEG
jgi:L-glutamine-phosphate cytidylyltransferase